MEGAGVDGRQAKDALYEEFARVAKAVASPRRIELLELLAQGERSVEALARAAGLGVTSASSHLQVLRAARLVVTRRAGTRILYRLAGEEVSELVALVRRLARERLAEVQQVVGDYFGARDSLAPIGRAELVQRAARGELLVLDVRPREEYAAGHIPGAVSIPLDELRARVDELPRGLEVVAYCRGPYCVLAPQALELLSARGIRARRLDEGLPEWRLAGLPVAVGSG
jgi:rhodanese-related sulfurtransferase/DNA-binding transcriptional ArsR family regulator